MLMVFEEQIQLYINTIFVLAFFTKKRIVMSPRVVLKIKIYFNLKIKAQFTRGFYLGLDCARPDNNQF